MYEYFNGVSEITVPDNLRSRVKKACFYDHEINPSYRDLAEHYGTCVIPARVREPRDKAKVEAAVLVAQRWILAVLRNQTFTSLAELNAAIL
jgi:transposase